LDKDNVEIVCFTHGKGQVYPFFDKPDMMNASNALSQVVPERIDNRFARPSTDARIQGTLLEHQHLNDLASKAPVEDMKPGGPGKELTAASALTSLVGPPAGQVDEPQEDFDIPQRFTKSGRKKAIPFPMKVRFNRSTNLLCRCTT
jgi:hypothetical protein